MLKDIVDLYSPLMNSFLRPRKIRRIQDGRTVGRVQHNSLKNLPEHTLKDLGFYSA